VVRAEDRYDRTGRHAPPTRAPADSCRPQENKLSLFTQELDVAASDPDVKAVVLRVNSPGGTVTCSDTMYDMLRRFRANTHKPVTASAQEVMASGAFYTSCGADTIFAEPPPSSAASA